MATIQPGKTGTTAPPPSTTPSPSTGGVAVKPSLSYSASNLVFPADLASRKYFITLTFYKYTIPNYYTGNATQQILNPLGTIQLPIPNYLVDSQMVVWDEEQLGLALGMGLNQMAAAHNLPNSNDAGRLIAGALGGAAGVVEGSALQGAINAINEIGTLVPGSSPSGIQGFVSAASGYAINPFMTVVFKTVAYKKHSLAWKLSPVNAAESATVNQIINTLKYNELPGITAGNALFTYPNVVQITISNVVADQQGQYFTFVFKPAVIQAVSVNYTPSGQPAFFNKTDAPSEVEVALSLSEIELWTQNDFSQAAAPARQDGSPVFSSNPGVSRNGQ